MTQIDTGASTSDPPREVAPGRRQRQVRLLVGGVLLAALIALFWPQGGGRKSVPGGFLLDAGGRPTPLGPRLAPVTLVHFWATWCPPCIDEVPALDRLAAAFADRPDFRIGLVAVDDTREQVEAFLGPQAAEDILYDPEWEVANRFGTTQLPETYLVVRGQVAEKFVGATNWDDPAVRAKLEKVISDQ